MLHVESEYFDSTERAKEITLKPDSGGRVYAGHDKVRPLARDHDFVAKVEVANEKDPYSALENSSPSADIEHLRA